jgi:hypothetical protein
MGVIMEPLRRAPRPELTRARGYRILVPVLLAVLTLVTIIVLALAGGVLLGVIPYPGR